MSSVKTTRIMIFGLNRMTRELIEGVIASKPELALVPAQAPAAVLAGRSPAPADVILIGEDDSSFAAEVLDRHPRMLVVAIVRDARKAVVYRLRLEREEQGELSESVLVDLFRRAGRVTLQ